MNTLQILGNQVLGVFIFLLLSRYLDKDSYGQLNWSLAILTTITSILSLRLDQIIVRDVAAGKDASSLLTIFLFHTLAGSLLLLLTLFIFRVPPLLWMLSFSQLLLFVALPFRQIVTGKGAFGWLAALASVSNVLRAAGLVVLVLLPAFTLTAVLWVFTVSALAEWVLGFGIVIRAMKVPLRSVRMGAYMALVRDSLPQIGSVFLNAGMARIDWILMGIFCSTAATAEYSFAYRAYELSPFPLLVIAPFVLNGFAKRAGEKPEWLDRLIRIELVCGTVLPLIGILLWKPVVGALTLDKYGESNFLPFVLLSCSIPFQYLINIYWSADMAANRLGRIFRITTITAGIVVVGDLIMIPLYGGVGAAGVWLVAMATQYILYAKDIRGWMLARIGKINWALLLFLVGVLNVKLYVKIVAIIFALFVHRKKQITIKRYHWFYIAMPALALLNLALSGNWTVEGFFAFGLGSGYWILALLAAWNIYCFVQEADAERLHRTVRVFFILNSAFILISFIVVCFQAGTINPYTFEGQHRRFYIMTGDLMRGVGLDGSVAAAMTGAMGFVYFLYRKSLSAALFCLATVLLCGSNTVAIMLIVISVVVFIFHTDRLQKSMIVVSFLLTAIFWAKISPQNGQYVQEILKRVDKRNVYVPPVPIPNAKNFEFVESKAVVKKEAAMVSFEKTLYPRQIEDSFKLRYKNYNRSGRWIAWQQMVQFFEGHPGLIPFGTGMGNFSSRLAFKTTALDIAGSYPEARRFIHPWFRDNYLYLYVFYHSRDEGQHSVVNKPDSVYGQVLTEYGIIGFILFVLLYAVFFAKGAFKLSFGLPILLLMGMAFFTEYWFEQLSIVIVFELLLLLDKKLT